MKIYCRLITAAWLSSWTTWGAVKVGTPIEAGALDWHGFSGLVFIIVISLLLGALSVHEWAGEKA